MRKLTRLSVLIVSLCIFATSCVTLDKCIDRYPVTYSDTLTVTYRDTVYFFRTDTDTVWATASWMDTVNVASGQIIGSAWVARDSIYIKVIQRDTVLQFRDSIRTEIKEIVKTVTVTEPCPKTPVLNKIIVILVLVIAIFIVAKILLR